MIAKKTSNSAYDIFDDSNQVGVATNVFDGNWIFKPRDYIYLTCRQLTEISKMLSELNEGNSHD